MVGNGKTKQLKKKRETRTYQKKKERERDVLVRQETCQEVMVSVENETAQRGN